MAEKDRSKSNITVGLIFVAVGLIFLLNTFNIIDYNIWQLVSMFWPVLLIIIGLNILFKGTFLWWISPVLIIILLLFLLFASANYTPALFEFLERPDNSQVTQRGNTYRSSMELRPELQRLYVNMTVDAGRIDIEPLEDNNNLYDMAFHFQKEEPEVDYHTSQGETEARLNINHMRSFELESIEIVNYLDLRLNRDVVYSLQIEAGAGHYSLDLEELQVSDLTINSGISEIKIDYSNYDNVTRINSGASDITMNFPGDIGVEIQTNNLVNNLDLIEAGFIKIEDNLYRSDNFRDAERRALVYISSPAISITVNFE